MQQVYCWLNPLAGNEGYEVNIEWQQADRSIRQCGNAAISKHDKITLRDEAVPLQTILSWLDDFKVDQLEHKMGEDGIYALGHYLYQQTLAQHPQHREFPNEPLRLTIISDCPHIHRIPWTMLSRDGFLLQNIWQIALSTTTPTRTVNWPTLPAILIMAPEPVLDNNGKALDPTQAQQHIDQIRKSFKHWSAYNRDDKFRVVKYWDDVQSALQNDRFDVVYFTTGMVPVMVATVPGCCLNPRASAVLPR